MKIWKKCDSTNPPTLIPHVLEKIFYYGFKKQIFLSPPPPLCSSLCVCVSVWRFLLVTLFSPRIHKPFLAPFVTSALCGWLHDLATHTLGVESNHYFFSKCCLELRRKTEATHFYHGKSFFTSGGSLHKLFFSHSNMIKCVQFNEIVLGKWLTVTNIR